MTITTLSTLNKGALVTLDTSEVRGPGYDRNALPVSVLHIGPGAFFRAHQVDYFDRLNELDPNWGIAAVALRSRKAPDALSRQDGLYTLVTLDREISYRVIGALLSVDYYEDDVALAHFGRETLKLVTLTITEKGYCLTDKGDLDVSHPDIRHDLAAPGAPVSAPGWLLKGLKYRKDRKLPGLSVLSCDNLPSNGEKLGRSLIQLAEKQDAELAEWIRSECFFPSSMVDSITPATTDAVIERVETALGYHDAWPIQREAFTQWVIEKTGDSHFPELEKVGVVLAENVELHEKAKLRMLNGTHSSLAYLGLAYGNSSVASAMANRELSRIISRMMSDEIIPSLEAPEGVVLAEYGDDLLDRYRNPAIEHRLAQIAWDGSKKLPIRLLETVRENLNAGRPVKLMARGVAAWMRFLVRMTRAGSEITDPVAETLKLVAGKAVDVAADDVPLFLGLRDVFGSDLPDNPDFVAAVIHGYADVMETEKNYKTEEAQDRG